MPEITATELRKKFKVDENFYPNLSMDIDLPNGFQGEINTIIEVLEKNGFSATNESVFRVMGLKKHLSEKYQDKVEGKRAMSDYVSIVQQKEPIGCVVPLDYYLVGGLVAFLLFAFARFTGSFLDETGKLAAQKLFKKNKTKKQLLKELQIDINEYNFFSNQTTVIIEKDGSIIATLKENLKEKKPNNSKFNKKLST